MPAHYIFQRGDIMKKIIQLLFLGAIILTSVLRVSAEDKPLPKPGVLTEESVMTSKRLSGYDILIIRDLAADGVEEHDHPRRREHGETVEPGIVR